MRAIAQAGAPDHDSGDDLRLTTAEGHILLWRQSRQLVHEPPSVSGVIVPSRRQHQKQAASYESGVGCKAFASDVAPVCRVGKFLEIVGRRPEARKNVRRSTQV